MHHDQEASQAIEEPVSVEVIGDKVEIDGSLPFTVSMTRDIALESGLKIVNAALGIKTDEA